MGQTLTCARISSESPREYPISDSKTLKAGLQVVWVQSLPECPHDRFIPEQRALEHLRQAPVCVFAVAKGRSEGNDPSSRSMPPPNRAKLTVF